MNTQRYCSNDVGLFNVGNYRKSLEIKKEHPPHCTRLARLRPGSQTSLLKARGL